ncbi:hypothetical protein N7495_009440 [Penicillium taxi]|uniref:uncharacterized protein n=1 Tax=Penicillium taxi TaxID=168475 RepID=UPI002544ED7A|nr:uncharacterized protein N7495_009440 [Penicillium taxi]KAJ5884930.1 hypothetical protein N7495_009440 [Penicillium taxi]
MEGDYANRSQTSLSLPRPNVQATNRRLLLIYIHGFMGSEASFHDLPAHVHDLLTELLSESHAVYTRIYPRYKSHGDLSVAVDQFSAWLSPHEADDLDIILLGHSLGGILAADVALLRSNGHPKHRILGLVNFDVPLLGLHPRVIPTGIGSSMPRKDVAAEDKIVGEQESMGLNPAYKPATPSPNFDPPFINDVRSVERGFFKGIMHFVNKNTDNLSRSIIDRALSSFKFANCVNNYSELRQRYRYLIELEGAEYSPWRVRFVNYYTNSTGRIPRKPKVKSKKGSKDIDQTATSPLQGGSENPADTNNDTLTSSEREELKDAATPPPEYSETDPTQEAENLSKMRSLSLEDQTVGSDITITPDEASSAKEFPQIDIASTTSSTSLDQHLSQNLSESVANSDASLISETTKEKKLRKFILLPSHHWRHNDNAHWIPVLMEDMDEVTAHQSMFIPLGANYEILVGETVALVERWVQDDLSRQLLQESLD